MNSYVLVTGGVHADIGKGTVAAVLARSLARSGTDPSVSYVKIDPCMQGAIDEMPATAFGEIARTKDGLAIDLDVARAAFLIPGFVPTPGSQRSLGRALSDSLAHWHEQRAPSPRLLDGLADLVRFQETSTTVVEVGGSAGEPEHDLVMSALLRHVGRPSRHVHVSALLRAVDGRPTSKPSQVAVERLAIVPDVVLARGDHRAVPALRAALPRGTVIVAVEEDIAMPERAAERALRCAGLVDTVEFASTDSIPRPSEVAIVGCEDESTIAGLILRLRLWSRGRLQGRLGPQSSACIGVIRLASDAHESPGIPSFELNPAGRDLASRPDWQGTFDQPVGPLASWIQRLCDRSSSASTPGTKPSPYAVQAFADRYLTASETGKLRDHSELDEHVYRVMGDLRGKRVLDLGCGAGRWSERLVAAGATVVGVEPAAPMIERARARALENLTLVEASAESFVPDGQFDGLLASMSLDHVEDLGGVLRRLSSSLRPGAWCIVTTEHPLRTATLRGSRWIEEGESRSARVRDYDQRGWRTFDWFGRPEPVHVFHRTVGEWLEVLVSAGLELVEVREPVSSSPRDGGIPRFWMLCARRREHSMNGAALR
jgi:SAM-dependent methyltransferase